MSIAAPPAWVLGLSLDSGSWRCLVGLWSFADYGADGPAHVWPTREQVADRTGQSANAVKKQLRKLGELGLITVAERGWLLSWGPVVPGPDTMGPDDAGPVVPCPDTLGPAAGPGVPGHLTYQDPAVPSRDLAADARERHLAIVAEREEIAAADPRGSVTREIVAAVRAAGSAWALQLEAPAWQTALGEAVRELELTPEQVGSVLAAWDRAVEAAGGVVAVEADRGRASGLPTRRALWWGKHRAWVAAQLVPGGASRVRSRSGIGCDWAEGETPTLSGRASW